MEDVSRILWLKSNVLLLFGLWSLCPVHYAFLRSYNSELQHHHQSLNLVFKHKFWGRRRKDDEGGSLSSRVCSSDVSRSVVWNCDASQWSDTFTPNSLVVFLGRGPGPAVLEHARPEFRDTSQGQGTRLHSGSAAVTSTCANGLSTEVKDCLDMKAESPLLKPLSRIKA